MSNQTPEAVVEAAWLAWNAAVLEGGHTGISAMRVALEAAGNALDQRGDWNNSLPHEIHDVLVDRETKRSRRAAEWVRENENNDLWTFYVGPMLDEIEREQGGKR